MKGKFLIEYPESLNEKGILRFIVLYQESEESELIIVKEQTSPKIRGNNKKNLIEIIYGNMRFKEEAANEGLKNIGYLKQIACSSDLEKLFETAANIGEKLIEARRSETFRYAQTKAKTIIDQEVPENKTKIYKIGEEDEEQPPTKKETDTRETRIFDLNDSKEKDLATRNFFGEEGL